MLVEFESFDAAMRMVRRAGRNCWVFKVDVKSAFKLLPVRREDGHLLVFR